MVSRACPLDANIDVSICTADPYAWREEWPFCNFATERFWLPEEVPDLEPLRWNCFEYRVPMW